MLDPIYSLPLTLLPDGTFAKALPGAGLTAVDPLPLGAPYADVFRKSRAPTARELVQQLVGTAYACASLNADLVASARLRLYIRTAKGQTKARQSLQTVPVSRK